MRFDLDGARKAGATDDQIAAFLAEKSAFDLDGARKAGATDGQIAEFLAAHEPEQPGVISRAGSWLNDVRSSMQDDVNANADPQEAAALATFGESQDNADAAAKRAQPLAREAKGVGMEEYLKGFDALNPKADDYDREHAAQLFLQQREAALASKQASQDAGFNNRFDEVTRDPVEWFNRRLDERLAGPDRGVVPKAPTTGDMQRLAASDADAIAETRARDIGSIDLAGESVTRGAGGVASSVASFPEAALKAVEGALVGLNEAGAALGMPEWMLDRNYASPVSIVAPFIEGKTFGSYRMAGTRDIADTIRNIASRVESDQHGVAIRVVSRKADDALEHAIKSGDTSRIIDVLSDPRAWAVGAGQAAPSLLASIVGGLPVMMAMEGGSALESLKEYEAANGGVDAVSAANAVIQTTAYNTWLEKLGVDAAMGKLPKAVQDKIYGAAISGLQGRIARGASYGLIGGAGEAGTEGLQGVNENLSARWYNPDAKLTDGVLLSVMGGAGSGASAGSVSGMVRGATQADAAIPDRAQIGARVDAGSVQNIGAASNVDEAIAAANAAAGEIIAAPQVESFAVSQQQDAALSGMESADPLDATFARGQELGARIQAAPAPVQADPLNAALASGVTVSEEVANAPTLDAAGDQGSSDLPGGSAGDTQPGDVVGAGVRGAAGALAPSSGTNQPVGERARVADDALSQPEAAPIDQAALLESAARAASESLGQTLYRTPHKGLAMAQANRFRNSLGVPVEMSQDANGQWLVTRAQETRDADQGGMGTEQASAATPAAEPVADATDAAESGQQVKETGDPFTYEGGQVKESQNSLRIGRGEPAPSLQFSRSGKSESNRPVTQDDLLTLFNEAETIEIKAPEMSEQEIDDAEASFLSDFPEGSRYTRKTRLLERVRRESDIASDSLGGSPEAERKNARVLGPFSAYGTRGQVLEPDSFNPKGSLQVHVYGKEQAEAGLDSEPALTITVTPDGDLTINGPSPNTDTFRAFFARGWADRAKGANGEIQPGWSALKDPANPDKTLPIQQIIPLLADVHARVRAWRGDEYVGLHWSRATGAMGGLAWGDQDTTAVYFSRKGKDDAAFAYDVLSELAAEDDAFRYQVSSSQNLETVFSEVAGDTVRYLGEDTRPDEREESQADRRHVFVTDKGTTFYVFERGDKEVWINVFRLQEGDGGSAIYAAAANYAHNTGKVFVGDPKGLSEAATMRRTVAMLSSALRFGTTKHLDAAVEQLRGDPEKGIPPLQWMGNDADKVASLIETFLGTIEGRFPSLKDYRYDFRGNRFVDSRGRPVDAARLEHGERTRDARSLRAGQATLRQAIFLQSLVSSESGAKPGILEQFLRGASQLVAEGGPLNRMFSVSGTPGTGITTESLRTSIAERIPSLSKAVDNMLARGEKGQRGGLVIIDSADEQAIADAVASKTGLSADESLEDVQASLRIFSDGVRRTGDFIVPETPEFAGNTSGDLAYLNDKPIRLTVGEHFQAHRGYGIVKLAGEAEHSSSRREPPSYTEDRAENFVRHVVTVANSADALFEEGGRMILRASRMREAIVLDDRGSHWSVISLRPAEKTVWGRPVRTGRGLVQSLSRRPASAPYQSSGSDIAPTPDRKSLGVRTEHFDLTNPYPDKQERIGAREAGKTVKVTVKKRRKIAPLFSSNGTIQGFYEKESGLTFLVGPNLTADTAPAVLLHEATHGQQRADIDLKAMQMIDQRDLVAHPKHTREFMGRVYDRMVQAGAVGDTTEAAAYIVEQAVLEGRQAGFSAADGKFMDWVDATLGKRIGNILRDFVAMIRGWAIRRGAAWNPSIDDLVAIAMAGVKSAARGDVVTHEKSGQNGGQTNPQNGLKHGQDFAKTTREQPSGSGSSDANSARDRIVEARLAGVGEDAAGVVPQGSSGPASAVRDRVIAEAQARSAGADASDPSSRLNTTAPGKRQYSIASITNKAAITPRAAPSAEGPVGHINSNLDQHGAGQSSVAAPPSETTARAVQRRIQDKFNRFTVIQDWLKDQGVSISEQADVYRAEERMHGRVATRTEDFREHRVGPLIKRIRKAGLKMSEVADFLHAQHAEERNQQIATINSAMQDGGSGMTTAEARRKLAEYRKTPQLVQLANELRAITDDTRKILLDSGIISQEIAAAWQATYSNYVPLKGGPDDAAQAGTGRGLTVRDKQKRALGHGERAEGEWIIENILRDHERAILMSEKNRIGQHLLQLAADSQALNLVTIDMPKKRSVLRDTKAYEVRYRGTIVEVFGALSDAQKYVGQEVVKSQRGPHDFTVTTSHDLDVAYMASPILEANETQVYVAGHSVRIQFNDDLLARAWNNLGAEHLNAVFRAARAVNTWLSRAFTAYSPEFFLKNLQRDFTTGLANLTGEEGAAFATWSLANYPKAFAELLRYAWTGNASNWIKQYRADGGTTGAAYLSDMERLGKDVQNTYDDYAGAVETWRNGGEWSRTRAVRVAAWKAIGPLVRIMERFNQAGENAMRLAAYKTAIKSGMSRAKAASLAKNSTVNFNRRGEIMPVAGALYLFLNPAVQGTSVIAHALFKGKHKHQAQALTACMIGLGYLVESSMGGGPEDEWEKLHKSTKERSMPIWTGDGWVTIQIAYGYGFFYGLGRHLAELESGKAERGDVALKLAASFMSEFTVFSQATNPDGDERNMFFLLPTVPQIIGQPLINQTGLGGEIYPASRFDGSQPDNLKMWRSTQGTAWHALSKALNKITGGNAVEAGWLDVSPETFKYLWNTTTGGAGKFVTDSASMMWSVGVNDVALSDLDAREVPILRTLYRSADDVRGARARFWDAAKEVKSATEAFSRMKKVEDALDRTSIGDKMLAERRELLAIADVSDWYIKAIAEKRDAVMRTMADKSSPLPQRRLHVREIEAEEARLYDEFVALFKKEEQKRKERLGRLQASD